MPNCITYPILQKHFNALKALEGLNKKDDLFNDIACIDSFFLEFRNITFVAQKNLNSPDLKKIYEKKRDHYLLNEKMKWFVTQRNKITKENPFSLEKDLIVYLYTPTDTIIKHFKSTLDEEISRNTLLKNLSKTLKKQQQAYFFSIKLIFLENSSEIDIYKYIKHGLKQMSLFIQDLQSEIPCSCKQCKRLDLEIKNLHQSFLIKEIVFTWDCEFDGDKLKHAERAELYLGGNNSYDISKDIRMPLKKSLFDKSDKKKLKIESIEKIFLNFTLFHLILYQKQEYSIMPVFMIIYSDDTYVLWPFTSTIKTTFYRISYEISQHLSKKKVVAVFYAGEYYVRENQNDKTPKEFFMCSMIDNKLLEKTVLFDSVKVDNMEYCGEKFKNEEKFDQIIFRPIKREFKKMIQS